MNLTTQNSPMDYSYHLPKPNAVVELEINTNIEYYTLENKDYLWNRSSLETISAIDLTLAFHMLTLNYTSVQLLKWSQLLAMIDNISIG
jgi:hypothetical protein